MNAQTAKITPGPTTVDDAIAIFDRSADRTKENHQTAAWKILRSEIGRLSEYEHDAGFLAIENAELRKLADQRAELLAEMVRYLPIIERAESNQQVWEKLTNEMGIATANGYRAAIQHATGEQP